MGIVIPGYHLRSPKDLPHLRERMHGGKKLHAEQEELTLTSMIDMFSIIIIFLIQSFSANGEVLLVNKAIKLPEAAHAQYIVRSPILTILQDKVTLEGAPVGSNANIHEIVEETDWDLPLLTRHLEDFRNFFKEVNPQAQFPNEIVIQADRKVNFVFVKRAMYSLVKIGYTNIRLVVRGVPSGGGMSTAAAAPTPTPQQ